MVTRQISSLLSMLFLHYDVGFGGIGMVPLSSTMFLQTVPNLFRSLQVPAPVALSAQDMLHIGGINFQLPIQ